MRVHLSKCHIVGNHMLWLLTSKYIQMHQIISSFLASWIVPRQLITFTKCLDPDQDQQNVGPDLGPNYLI